MRLTVPLEGRSKTIEFNFDPATDTPEQTSMEIAAEFQLDKEQAEAIADQISNQLKCLKLQERHLDATAAALNSNNSPALGSVMAFPAKELSEPQGAEIDALERTSSLGTKLAPPSGKGGLKPSLSVYKMGAITVVAETPEAMSEGTYDTDENQAGDHDLNGLGENLDENATLICRELVEYSARGNLTMVEICIASGADVNYADYDGRTALHLAATENHPRVVRFLIRHGADFTKKDRKGNTPVDNALSCGSYVVLQALKDFNAALDDRLVRGARETHVLTGFELIQAAAVGDLTLVKKFLDQGVDCNVKDYDYRTPLHLAVAEGQDQVAMALLSRGANPFAQDRWGVTPIGEALRNNDRELALRLGYKEIGVLQNKEHADSKENGTDINEEETNTSYHLEQSKVQLEV